MMVGSAALYAQTDVDSKAINNTSKENGKLQLMLRTKPPVADRTQILDIVSIKRTSFIVSNTGDGTEESYKHSKHIILELLASNNTSYEIVFYSPEEKIPLVFSNASGKSIIYYPISMYDVIKQKLDQSFVSKKKVQVQIVEKTTGFREVSLIF